MFLISLLNLFTLYFQFERDNTKIMANIINFTLFAIAISLLNCNINVSGAFINNKLIGAYDKFDNLLRNNINDEPPPITDYAKTARYLVHRSGYC